MTTVRLLLAVALLPATFHSAGCTAEDPHRPNSAGTGRRGDKPDRSVADDEATETTLGTTLPPPPPAPVR